MVYKIQAVMSKILFFLHLLFLQLSIQQPLQTNQLKTIPAFEHHNWVIPMTPVAMDFTNYPSQKDLVIIKTVATTL